MPHPRTREHLRRDERGSVTAEFAVALPAVLVVLGLVIGGVLLVTYRLTLTSAAADIARLEARGDHDLAEARIAELPGAAQLERSDEGALHCVTLRARPAGGLLANVGIAGSGCAARSGVGGERS